MSDDRNDVLDNSDRIGILEEKVRQLEESITELEGREDEDNYRIAPEGQREFGGSG